MKIDGTPARNIGSIRKTRWKTSILKLQSPVSPKDEFNAAVRVKDLND